MKNEPLFAIVIDDNREAANSLCQMLQLLGLKALPVYGARAALMTLNRLTPHIIFIDINMPGLNGFEVMAFLRRIPNLAEVPVVFITSDDQPETADRVRQSGALEIIIKPVTLDALESALQEARLIES